MKKLFGKIIIILCCILTFAFYAAAEEPTLPESITPTGPVVSGSVTPAPGIVVSITGPGTEDTDYVQGETIEYVITLSNTGNQALSEIEVRDTLTGFSKTVPILAAGNSTSFRTTYRVTETDVQTGYLVNSVTARATGNAPGATFTDTDTLEVSLKGSVSEITITHTPTKTVTPTTTVTITVTPRPTTTVTIRPTTTITRTPTITGTTTRTTATQTRTTASTGDPNNMTRWILLIAAACAVIVIAVILIKKSGKKDD